MIYRFIIILIIAISSSCVTKRYIVDYNAHFVNYEKVKISIRSNNIDATLKGNIILDNYDSTICFKFIGPLGFAVVSGFIGDTTVIIDKINNLHYSSFNQISPLLSDFNLNRAVLFKYLSFVMPNPDSVLSTHSIYFAKSEPSKLIIVNKITGIEDFIIRFKTNKFIELSSPTTKVKIEFLYISNKEKRCKFEN